MSFEVNVKQLWVHYHMHGCHGCGTEPADKRHINLNSFYNPSSKTLTLLLQVIISFKPSPEICFTVQLLSFLWSQSWLEGRAQRGKMWNFTKREFGLTVSAVFPSLCPFSPACRVNLSRLILLCKTKLRHSQKMLFLKLHVTGDYIYRQQNFI